MSLTSEQTKKVAKLARIRLSEEEVEHYTGELNHILDWIDQLQQVNTDGVAPMTSVEDLVLPMREDAVADGSIQDKVLQNAPASDYGCFVVPKVIE